MHLALDHEYAFDVAAWRARAGDGGPAAVAVEIGAGGLTPAWETIGPVAGPELRLSSDGGGVQRVLLEGGATLP